MKNEFKRNELLLKLLKLNFIKSVIDFLKKNLKISLSNLANCLKIIYYVKRLFNLNSLKNLFDLIEE